VAVYTRLSSLLADALPSVEACVDAMARADVRAATARLSIDLALVFPEVVDAPRLDLRSARHPLLMLDGVAAVPSDLALQRGGAVAATTHYEGLKALALADPRFRNASVGFDLATMTPTFRLALDVPGSSSALAVARRYGMPSTVIERAQRYMSREDQNFETV